MQRVTGVLLVVWIGLHFTLWHFWHMMHADITASEVGAKAGPGGFWWWAWGMVFAMLCLFHGLNGVRGIVLDYGPSRRVAGWLTAALWMLGIGTATLCGYHLSRF